MKTIKTIPPITLLSEYRGRSMAAIIYFGMLFFLIVGIAEVSSGEEIWGILCLLMGLSPILLSRGRIYQPGKTFWGLRLDKQGLNKCVIISVIIILVVSVFSLIAGYAGGVGSAVVGLVSLYYWYKSIKFHENIDYEANQHIVDLLGGDINEKIIASYQNFDGTERNKKDDNIIIVTNRKIFFALFNGHQWVTMNKLIQDIEQIGLARNDVNSYLKLVFSDNTSLGLRLDLYEKITTTPQLFVRQVLYAIDAYLLGYEIAPSVSRRRVAVEPSSAQRASQDTAVNTRRIELSAAIATQIKNAEEIQSGRKIEI